MYRQFIGKIQRKFTSMCRKFRVFWLGWIGTKWNFYFDYDDASHFVWRAPPTICL